MYQGKGETSLLFLDDCAFIIASNQIRMCFVQSKIGSGAQYSLNLHYRENPSRSPRSIPYTSKVYFLKTFARVSGWTRDASPHERRLVTISLDQGVFRRMWVPTSRLLYSLTNHRSLDVKMEKRRQSSSRNHVPPRFKGTCGSKLTTSHHSKRSQSTI